jgi:serine/threonine protein kinase
MLSSGDLLDAKYRIVRHIGEGGMGVVVSEAEQVRLRRRVALKVLRLTARHAVNVVAGFELEAQAAGRIGSEHIVDVLDLGELPSGERPSPPAATGSVIVGTSSGQAARWIQLKPSSLGAPDGCRHRR